MNSRSGYVYKTLADLLLSLWKPTRYSQGKGLSDNTEFLKEVKVDGLRASSIPSLASDGMSILYACNYSSDNEGTVTFANPGSYTKTNADDFTNRHVLILGSVKNLASPSNGVPGGPDANVLNFDAFANVVTEVSGGMASAWKSKTVPDDTPGTPVFGGFFTSTGQTDETGDYKYYMKGFDGNDNRAIAVYVDSSTGYLKFFWTEFAGISYNLWAFLSPKFDIS